YGFYVFAAGCASILSYVTSIIVLEVLQLEWRWIFRLPVLLMLAGGIIFYLVARERPQDMGFEALADTGVANAEDKNHEVAHGAVESSLQRYK
ncbi:MFS transporter, partial [Streptococcus pneumoniae]